MYEELIIQFRQLVAENNYLLSRLDFNNMKSGDFVLMDSLQQELVNVNILLRLLPTKK